jgi:hypothetical protein
MAGNATGMAVDPSGGPVIDPTENVKDAVNAAVRRLDDIAALDRQHRQILADEQHKHIREVMDLERAHNKELRDKERDRLDAVRAVDVSAVSTAASAAENRAATLATQVQLAAEAMRASAEATRLNFTETLNSTIKPLSDAIVVIQQWMNQQTGQRAQVVESRDTRQDQRGNQQLIWQIVAVAAAIFAIYIATR